MTQPPEGVDPRANTDDRGYDDDQTSYVARGTGGEAGIPAEPPAPGDEPEVSVGTASGNPLSGVQISEEEAEDAVPGDMGPEHPGVRRNT